MLQSAARDEFLDNAAVLLEWAGYDLAMVPGGGFRICPPGV